MVLQFTTSEFCGSWWSNFQLKFDARLVWDVEEKQANIGNPKILQACCSSSGSVVPLTMFAIDTTAKAESFGIFDLKTISLDV